MENQEPTQPTQQKQSSQEIPQETMEKFREGTERRFDQKPDLQTPPTRTRKTETEVASMHQNVTIPAEEKIVQEEVSKTKEENQETQESSNTDLPQKDILISSGASQDKDRTIISKDKIAKVMSSMAEKTPLFIKFCDYIKNEWSEGHVLKHICNITQSPAVICTPPSKWCDGLSMPIESIVYEYMTQDVILLALWPIILLVMNDNVDNMAWTAQVATSFAFFACIARLPEILWDSPREG